MGKTLFMTIKRKWFYEILMAQKKIEHRRVCDYWTARIVDKEYDNILFKNGYNTNSPMLLVEYLGYDIGSWNNQPSYDLRLGNVILVKNVSGFPHRPIVGGRYL